MDSVVVAALIGAGVIVIVHVVLFAVGYGRITARQDALDKRSDERYQTVNGRLERIEKTLNGLLSPTGGKE